MVSFLPIAIVAYVFNAGALLVDKVLLRTTLPNPVVYTFYVNLLQLLVLFLIPFGFNPTLDTPTYFAIASGMVGILAFYTYFSSLKANEASVVGPVVGTFNPLFALLLGGFFLGQILSPDQYTAFFVLIIGTFILTWNFWKKGLQFNKKFAWMLASGFFFGLSYVLLREAFLGTSFINGFIISRLSAGGFALLFLLFPETRKQIFNIKRESQGVTSKITLLLLAGGQIMGALSVTLITFGVSLANPAIVNSLFGVQYLVILIVSLILARKNPNLLDEPLSKNIIYRKALGAVVISIGLYLLAK